MNGQVAGYTLRLRLMIKPAGNQGSLEHMSKREETYVAKAPAMTLVNRKNG